jgi:hypothetical protein
MVKQYEQATHKNHEIVADAKALYSGAPIMRTGLLWLRINVKIKLSIPEKLRKNEQRTIN